MVSMGSETLPLRHIGYRKQFGKKIGLKTFEIGLWFGKLAFVD